MRFDYRAADGKSQSHSFFFGRVKRIKNPVETARIQTDAGISNGDENIIIFILTCFNRQARLNLSRRFDGFNAVHYQIQQNLLQPEVAERVQR